MAIEPRERGTMEDRAIALYTYSKLNKRYGKALKDRQALALAKQQKYEAKKLLRAFGKKLARECP